MLRDEDLGVELAIWIVDEWRGEPRNTGPDDHDDLAWLGPAEWPALTVADDRYRPFLATAVAG